MPDGLRPLVVIPTYQEAENIATVLQRVRRRPAGRLGPRRRRRQPRRHRRPGRGQWRPRWARSRCCDDPARRGSAARTGPASRTGIARGFDVLVEMDADLSHDPADLPRLLAGGGGRAPSLAIGSRYVPGGATPNWPWPRLLAVAVGQPLRRARARAAGCSDATAGFRAYRADDPRGDRLRDHQRRWLRVPGGDGLPGAHAWAGRSPSFRSPSATASGARRRCRAGSWSRRCCSSPGGAIRDRVLAGRLAGAVSRLTDGSPPSG